MSSCCLTGFNWEGTPKGKEGKLASLDAYITGSNSDAAVLIIHDVFGWTFKNTRILADHYATEADTTVYVIDSFGGEVIDPDTMDDPAKREKFDLPGFLGRNSKELRWPAILECAKQLKSEYKRVGAVGFCYGAWACFKLGEKGNNVVDCISMAHPSLVVESEIDNVGVPVQIMAPENDPAFTPELKNYANTKIPTLGVDYDYQFFPGLNHGFAIKCNPKDKKQREGLERAKNCAVTWWKQYLHPI